MTARRSRRRIRWDQLVARSATAAGLAVRYGNRLTRVLPGILGPILACFGLGMIYRPLFFIGIGLALVAFDRRIP